MATQLIMTVGTNALSVWAVPYDLKREIEGSIKLRKRN